VHVATPQSVYACVCVYKYVCVIRHSTSCIIACVPYLAVGVCEIHQVELALGCKGEWEHILRGNNAFDPFMCTGYGA
jgi:hypothetical protein